jgi:hypothetical protein
MRNGRELLDKAILVESIRDKKREIRRNLIPQRYKVQKRKGVTRI